MSYYEYLFYQNKSPFHHLFTLEGKKKKKDKIKSWKKRGKNTKTEKKSQKKKHDCHTDLKTKKFIFQTSKKLSLKWVTRFSVCIVVQWLHTSSLQNEHSPQFYKNFIGRLTAFQAQMDWAARHSFLGFPSGLVKIRC